MIFDSKYTYGTTRASLGPSQMDSLSKAGCPPIQGTKSVAPLFQGLCTTPFELFVGRIKDLCRAVFCLEEALTIG